MAVAIAFGSQASAATSSLVATISGMTFNAAASDRLIAVALSYEDTSTVTGVTIGGVTASSLRAAADTNQKAEIWQAAVPTGTTGNVVITINTGAATISAATHSITGADATPTDTDAATGSAATISITALTIPTDGAGLTSFNSATAGTGITWTGASETTDTDIGAGSRQSAAIVTTVGTNTITADGPTAAQALVGVAWGPAAGGATAYNADLTAGSFALTGTSIDVPTGRPVSLTAGSFALTGSAVDAVVVQSVAYTADLTPGSFALTGTSITVPTGRPVSLSAGSFALTGTSITVPTGRPVDLSAGALAITGSDLTVPTGRLASLTPGSFALTGSDIDGVYVDNGVAIAYSADLLPGSMVLTGSSLEVVATGQTATDTHDGFGYAGSDPFRRKRRPKKGKREKAVEGLLKKLMGLVPDDPPPEIEAEVEIAQASVERVFAPTVDVAPNLEALQFAQLQLAKLEAMLNRYLEDEEDTDDLLLMAA